MSGYIRLRFLNQFKGPKNFISQNFLYRLSAAERNLFIKKPACGWRKKHRCTQANSEKKDFPETDSAAMKMARKPHCLIGKLSAFLGPYKAEAPVS